MELFRTDDFYIFVKDEHSLWWDRQTGAFIPKTGWDLADAEDPTCLGICYGLIGKVEHPSVFDPRLLIIREFATVGKIHTCHEVYKIKSIAFLHLGLENTELNLHECHKHRVKSAPRKNASNPFIDLQKNVAFTKTLGTLKSAGNAIKSTTQQAAAMAVGSPLKRDAKEKEKFERQILEEFLKIFNETNSFYFSHTCDITSSLQRFCNNEQSMEFEGLPLWKTIDDRFFWNKHMLKQLIDTESPLVDPWIMPIIQGYIQIEECRVELEQDVQGVRTSPRCEVFQLALISRRSRFRAGTRYKRRGVDEAGECANYVETEQLVAYAQHEVSFVQARGSVPVFWSQPGYEYRPPPRLDRGAAETRDAFACHFRKEVARYGPVCVVNLVDQTGREKVIWDAYSQHVFEFNSPHVTYVTFDFHEYCRGMRFENVSLLVSSVADVVKTMGYCWRDRRGRICAQAGVFRVNCIDCLDRTNVVQTALAKAVVEIQLCKLGLIAPEGAIPDAIKSKFQLLWANNGDTISRQYAGTNALKGDYTRTGERKFTGIMKDGMNSANRFYRNHFSDNLVQCCLDLMHGDPVAVGDAQDVWAHLSTFGSIASELVVLPPPSTSLPLGNLAQEFELANALLCMYRYYLSRFKDATRQGTIDLMLGNYVGEDMFDSRAAYEEDSLATAEHVKLVVEDAKKMLINEPARVVGAWGLINADPCAGDPNETEMDAIVILTRDAYYVADYDDQVDKVTKYQRVLLRDIVALESGVPEAAAAAGLFRSSGRSFYCIRINYRVDGADGYYHMLRSTNLRFFNNMAVLIKSHEEEIESLKAICESFIVAMDIAGLPSVPFLQGHKLERKKSKIVADGLTGSNIYLDVVGLPHLTRNVSESQLLALKNAGSKALSNMSQQFSKLNRLGSSLKPKKPARFTIGRSGGGNSSGGASSSESDADDEEYETSIFQPSVGADIAGGSSLLRFDSAASDQQQPPPGSSAVEDAFLPSVGIVMGTKTDDDDAPPSDVLATKNSHVVRPENLSHLCDAQITSVVQSVSLHANPEIQISCAAAGSGFEAADVRVLQPPSTLRLDRTHSHSSGEVRTSPPTTTTTAASASALDVSAAAPSPPPAPGNISSSQSESALRSRLVTLTSPVASATKGLVISPLSKIARGVQSFGANLDPRRMHAGGGGGAAGVRHVNERDDEEHRKLQEKWRTSKTKLIAL